MRRAWRGRPSPGQGSRRPGRRLGDLIVTDTPAAAAGGETSTFDCWPETKRALEEQIAAIAQGEGEAEGG